MKAFVRHGGDLGLESEVVITQNGTGMEPIMYTTEINGSPPAPKLFVPSTNVLAASNKHVCLQWVAVIVVASDKCIHLLFGSWIRNPLPPKKRTETRRKSFWKKNFISSYGWTCKMDRNKAGMRKLENTTPLQNDGALLSDLQLNVPVIASLVHFVVCKVN